MRRLDGGRVVAPTVGRKLEIRGILAVLAALALLLLCLAAPGCGAKGEGSAAGADSAGATAEQDGKTGEAAPDSAAPREEKAVKVDAALVRRGDLVVSIMADGAIRTPRAVEIRARAAGQLLEVKVRDGDRVRAGQLLARLDPREYQLQLQEARYRRSQALSLIAAEGDTAQGDPQAEAAYEQRRAELASQRAAGEITEQQERELLLTSELSALEKGAFRERVREQRTGLAEAELAEQRALLALEYTEIRAPFAGTVQNVAAVRGEILSVGEQVCSIYDNDRLEAVVNVLEADLGDLEEGRPALVAVPATGDTVRAKVDVLSPSLDPTSRTCEAILRFPNREGRLRPGMFARAEIAGWIHHDRLLVPREAVLTRDDRPLVFKVEDGRARWLYVTVGLQNETWIEITDVGSGGTLEPGDQVVVSDHLTLAHEAKLDIRQVREIADRWREAPGGGAAAAAAGRTP